MAPGATLLPTCTCITRLKHFNMHLNKDQSLIKVFYEEGERASDDKSASFSEMGLHQQ